jgi:hypothetical protein
MPCQSVRARESFLFSADGTANLLLARVVNSLVRSYGLEKIELQGFPAAGFILPHSQGPKENALEIIIDLSRLPFSQSATL